MAVLTSNQSLTLGFLTPSDTLPAGTCGGMPGRRKMTLQFSGNCGQLLV